MPVPQPMPPRDSDSEPHGGRLAEARARFPAAPEPFIDLSTGINPLPYPIPPLLPEAWTRLPEPEEIAALQAAAAVAYGARDRSLVAALPGTQTLISLLPSIFPQDSVAILGPTYSEYARAFGRAGSDVREAASLADLAEASCAVVCNPNNPDGRRFAANDLLSLLDARKGQGLLLVDESFVDLEDGALSLAPSLPRPGVVVLRSLSKSYGLGGLRLGFALAAPELASSLRAGFGPWPVSGPAIGIGIKALSDRAWRADARAHLQAGAKRLDALLRGAGLSPLGGSLLFRLAGSDSAARIHTKLGEAGILVRRFERQPAWLRFGIPGDEWAWARLAAALS